MRKKCTFEAQFPRRGQLCANFLFYVLSFCLKWLLFQFLKCGMPMHIATLTWVQNAHISRWRNNHLLKKCTFYCYFYILPLRLKFLIFQFLSHGIRIHISILAGVQNGCISLRKNSHIFLKIALFEALFPR